MFLDIHVHIYVRVQFLSSYMKEVDVPVEIKWQPVHVFTFIAIVTLLKLLGNRVILLHVLSVSADLHRQCSQGHSTKGHQEEDWGSRNPPYTGM